MNLLPAYEYDISVVIVVLNVRDLLRQCLQSLFEECARLPEGVATEVLVVDNGSSDGTAEMVAREFSSSPVPVRLIRSEINLGFAAANNVAMEETQGRYIVPLNSDAFFHPGALRLALEHMESSPAVGIGGARLVGRNGEWQPSARNFHTIWRDILVYSGLSTRFPHSRIFGAPERTWADPNQQAEVDWMPGAFLIIRRELLAKIGLFDPAFFVYCDDVDLCRRAWNAGYRVMYWPDVVVTHIGGETTRKLRSLVFSEIESQVVLWRMRSILIYYRKHHGWQAWLARWLEEGLYTLRRIRNYRNSDPVRRERGREAAILVRLMRQAWRETEGGRISPPRPW
jgi:GT2 family glycosyltransferase